MSAMGRKRTVTNAHRSLAAPPWQAKRIYFFRCIQSARWRVLASGGLSLPSQMSYQAHYPAGLKPSACLLACCRDKANTPGLAEWTFVGRK